MYSASSWRTTLKKKNEIGERQNMKKEMATSDATL
jgi:hypothetical protein